MLSCVMTRCQPSNIEGNFTYPEKKYNTSYLNSQVDSKNHSTISATNYGSYIIELLQLHDNIQIIWNYAWMHYRIAIRSNLMI